MPTNMRVTNLNFAKGGRNLKEVKHCTIPKTLNEYEKEKSFWSIIENSSGKEEEKSHRGENVEKCTMPSLGM